MVLNVPETTGTRVALRFMCPSHVAGQELDELSSPLQDLLASGGDPRLRLNPSDMLNGYGCQPWPRPEAFSFASSTATSISGRGLAAAAGAQRRILSRASGDHWQEVDRQVQGLREEIKILLQLGVGTEVVFSPSGTDSQIHALFVAQTVLGGPLVSVIVGADEAGSGTARAMTGCHFSSSTAQGGLVRAGTRVAGFAKDTVSVEIALRDTLGRLRSSEAVDQQVLATVGEAVGAGRSVVLHAMDASKFGSHCPTLDCLRQVQSNWAPSVQVIVDACQMRLGRQRLGYYLEQECMVLITGSKFFTGPPLSGALLVPAGASAVMRRSSAVPDGLALYTNQSDWPPCWPGIRAHLPARPNAGQLLRWSAAAEEMKAYFAVPGAYRALALREFSRVVPRLVARRPNLRLVPVSAKPAAERIDEEEMAAQTIFPFLVIDRGEFLSLEEVSDIYRALNRDVSSLLPLSATERQRETAARLCHIGQPVPLRTQATGVAGTLRLSAGARVVSDTWRAARSSGSLSPLDAEFEQVGTILDKIDLLVENLARLREDGNSKDLHGAPGPWARQSPGAETKAEAGSISPRPRQQAPLAARLADRRGAAPSAASGAKHG